MSDITAKVSDLPCPICHRRLYERADRLFCEATLQQPPCPFSYFNNSTTRAELLAIIERQEKR